MFEYGQWIQNDYEVVASALGVLVLVALILLFIYAVRFNRLYKKYRQLMRGTNKSNLEELLIQQADELQNLRNQVRVLQEAQGKVHQDIASSIGPIGIVRYNAFGDVGSDLSFSVALLDRNKNGVVISSLYGREDTRIYAKPIQNGDSTYKLTEEEKQAIEQAIRNFQR